MLKKQNITEVKNLEISTQHTAAISIFQHTLYIISCNLSYRMHNNLTTSISYTNCHLSTILQWFHQRWNKTLYTVIHTDVESTKRQLIQCRFKIAKWRFPFWHLSLSLSSQYRLGSKAQQYCFCMSNRGLRSFYFSNSTRHAMLQTIFETNAFF